MLLNAIHFFSLKHVDPRKKDQKSSPYINHQIDVMCILSNCGVTDYEILARAVLHN